MLVGACWKKGWPKPDVKPDACPHTQNNSQISCKLLEDTLLGLNYVRGPLGSERSKVESH